MYGTLYLIPCPISDETAPWDVPVSYTHLFGNIRDNASPALLEIRRAIREREGQAAKRLQAVLAAAKGAGIVDADAQISIREGKAVIPVAAANKRKLQGFIHDESATGRTFYVEPVEVVEINNELRELEYEMCIRDRYHRSLPMRSLRLKG